MDKSNPSGFRPVEYNVVVKPEEVSTRVGSILMPDETRDRKQAFETRGVIVAVSPLAFSYERWPDPDCIPQVGDTVVFAKAAGIIEKGVDGEPYRVLKDKDIMAVIERPSEMVLAALDRDIAEMNAEAVNE